MNERETLLEAMNNAMRNQKPFLEYPSLESVISDEKKCVAILRSVLKDGSFEIPEGDQYKIVQNRAEHSMINYAMGLVFCEFLDVYSRVDEMAGGYIEKRKKVAEELWFWLALNHDVGYFRKEISDGRVDYKKCYRPYLFQDVYSDVNENNYKCLDGMSQWGQGLFAFSYDDILDYDKRDRKRREQGHGSEKVNHGILGGAYYFSRRLREIARMQDSDTDEIKMAKAVAITIAQHNMYKSNSMENNIFYPKKLWYESEFKIGKEYPLLLFLALIDTVECVKKLGKNKERKGYLQARTVLKSIRIKVDRSGIEIDYSELNERVKKKQDSSLQESYTGYIRSVKELGVWTCLKVENMENNNVLRIYVEEG